MALRLVNRTRVPFAVSQLPIAMTAGRTMAVRVSCSHGGAKACMECPELSWGSDRASGGTSPSRTPITLPTPAMTMACQNPNARRTRGEAPSEVSTASSRWPSARASPIAIVADASAMRAVSPRSAHAQVAPNTSGPVSTLT